MTTLTSIVPCTRRGSRPFQLRSMMALAAALTVAPTSLLAEAQIQGSPEAVRIETQNSSIEEVLAALGNAFDLRYRSSANLAKQLSGTYEGSLQRVVARVLEGYDFVLRNNKGKIEITVLGTRGAAPAAAVASATSNPPKAAPIPPAMPASAAPPNRATEQPAPATAPAAPTSKPIMVAEGQIPGLVPAKEPSDLSKIPGMNVSASPTDGQVPGLVPAATPVDLSKIPGMNVVATPADAEIPGLVPATSPLDLSKVPGMSVVASPMPTTGLSPNSADGQGSSAGPVPLPIPGAGAAASSSGAAPGLMPASPPALHSPARH
jgi:hypothetical protein